MGPSIKVVLDTNVFISALLWYGRTAEILDLAHKGRITICVSGEIIQEFEKVLFYPKFAERFLLMNKTPTEIINELTEVVEYYPGDLFEISLIKEDPSDNKFLACALAANVAFIISGDQHLLRLKKFKNIPILTPNQFLEMVKFK